MDKVTFTLDTDEKVDFYVLEQTKISGCQYILVTEEEEGDSDALILKETASDKNADGVYEVVTDTIELQAVASVFENLLGDVTFADED